MDGHGEKIQSGHTAFVREKKNITAKLSQNYLLRVGQDLRTIVAKKKKKPSVTHQE